MTASCLLSFRVCRLLCFAISQKLRKTHAQGGKQTSRRANRHLDIQMDYQTERQADTETDRQTQRQTDRQRGRETQTDRQTDRQNRQTHGWMDRQTGRQTKQTDTWMDGQADKQAGRHAVAGRHSNLSTCLIEGLVSWNGANVSQQAGCLLGSELMHASFCTAPLQYAVVCCLPPAHQLLQSNHRH